MRHLALALLLAGCAAGPQVPLTTSITRIHLHCSGGSQCRVVGSGAVDAKPLTTGNEVRDNTITPQVSTSVAPR